MRITSATAAAATAAAMCVSDLVTRCDVTMTMNGGIINAQSRKCGICMQSEWKSEKSAFDLVTWWGSRIGRAFSARLSLGIGYLLIDSNEQCAATCGD